MRKLIISLLAVAVLGAGSAVAQSGYYVGASTGFPLGLTVHLGLEDLLGPNIDLRANLDGSYVRTTSVSGFTVAIGADVLYGLSDVSADPRISPYVGGGLTLGFGSFSTATDTAAALAFDVHGLAGVEYLLSGNWGVYGEVQLGYGSAAAADSFGNVVTLSGITYSLSIGVNYHF